MNTKIDLRPQKLADFIGKDVLMNDLKTAIYAAIQQNKPLDHILFYGYPGVGKTSLAHAIANELGVQIHLTQGNLLTKTTDILNLLSLINEKDIVFIDEIHSCPSIVLETLYSIMEDFAIDVHLGKDLNMKTTRLKVPTFTLIAATTAFGKIPQPLEERFGHLYYLSEYNKDEMSAILYRNAQKLKTSLTVEDCWLMANYVKGVPRLANRLLKRVIDYQIVYPKTPVEEILKHMQMFDDGLSLEDVHYLQVLFAHEEEMGLKTLSQMLMTDPQTIETKIEPFLLKNQYIIKNLKGRKISAKGCAFIINNQLQK
ncbi:Holliday junction branch migration DNA helicase RuvB [Ureaplasma miroungigenitalium]|uniref:Holliday junction branch migration complex subunit RuvB n=1 Tax=Ureaplasma miroungigenitalium TaxID=1042321 RepID=A0ABT3BLT8_9BACT|nr:Holliday junction branch migration DNA helicase RuvB [Ureaplasma miroungigenitalium]MCV3728229.1 Holliday junction branch migration DNA helicase RuvB [Ureaplasma miroungigenitalium]MCV3734033.1 Holliday junction branch migration DNA helicase RuvB [Ureaplasma miroungigenitalium]